MGIIYNKWNYYMVYVDIWVFNITTRKHDNAYILLECNWFDQHLNHVNLQGHHMRSIVFITGLHLLLLPMYIIYFNSNIMDFINLF